MNKPNANNSLNEVSDHSNSNVVPFPERRGIQFLPSVSAYVDRALSPYEPENVRWNGLDVVKAIERVGRYTKTRVRIQFPYGNAGGGIKVTGPGRVAALPTEQEEAEILAELAGYRWPVLKTIPNLKSVPSPFNGKEDDRLDFYDLEGEPIMVQFMKRVKGEKIFIPVTFWDDGFKPGVYPPGTNPIYNVHLVKPGCTVLVNEGGKAARVAQEIADGKHPDHPWADYLKGTVSVGWIDGALASDETDFSVLKALGASIVYIVPDADEPGENAVPNIARQIDLLTYKLDLLGLGDKPGFDLADPFSSRLFKSGRYTGPSFIQRRSLATWATDEKVVPPPADAKANAKPSVETHLRSQFHQQWFYSTEDGIHVNRHFPSDIYDDDHLDRELGPFSDTAKLSAMLRYSKKTAQRVRTVDVWPGQDRIFTDDKGRRHFNAWSKPLISTNRQGDLTKWNEFLEYFIPDAAERSFFKRWVYTLIAKPEVRIGWSVLLQSSEGGTGKTTVGKILAELVGNDNVSFPTTKDVEGSFNGWAAFKKLAIFQEFYTGGNNFKVSNMLKSLMTDDYMFYNEKFKVARKIKCFVEILACSNSSRAIDLDDKDRRWFVPTLTEIIRDKAFWDQFYLWLRSGGLEAINFDAHNCAEYFSEGDRPMKTKKHAEFVANSNTEIQTRLAQFHEDWADVECWLTPSAVHEHVARGQRVWPEDGETANRKWLESQGWRYYSKTKVDGKEDDRRPRRSGKRVNVLVSPELHARLEAVNGDRQPTFDAAQFLNADYLKPF